MSPSWLERLTLLVHPRRIVVERRPRRGEPVRKTVEFAAPADTPALLAAIQELLASEGRFGAELRVVVADPLVRYALLPWSPLVTGKKARLAMARALLQHALGTGAEALEIALDRPLYGHNGIAAGIDRALLDGLRSSARQQRLRLSSVQPALLAELAARGKALDDGWLALIDDGWLALLGVRGGQPGCLRNHRMATADAASFAVELAGLLTAEAVAVDGKKVLISSFQNLPASLPGDWSLASSRPLAWGAGHA